MRKDFLLEIGTEEVPSAYLEQAGKQLEQLVCELLHSNRVQFGEIKRFYTPRRLAILIRDVVIRQEDKIIEITGPPKEFAFDKDGNPTKQGLGFAKAHNISFGRLKIKKRSGKEVVYYEKEEKGKLTKDIFKTGLPNLVKEIAFPKTMKWEHSGMRFARPIRWICSLFGEEIISFEIAGIKSGNKSEGLRFSPSISLMSARKYEQELEKVGITPDFQKRRNKIRNEIIKVRAYYNTPLQWIEDEELLSEVTNLVESARAIMGKFDKKFLNLPEEVIIAALKGHQRYFAMKKKNGRLAPYFIIILNSLPHLCIGAGLNSNLDEIRQGHERVLRARLEDAEFYFKEDTRIKLADRIDLLKGVIWREELGTLYDKTQRILDLSGYIARWLPDVDFPILERAALLSKTDLVTSMIRDGKEFTKLEGIIGRKYAKISGEEDRVATIIYEHYLPRFKGDKIPKTLEGMVLSIADKVDNVTGAFIINKVPTGSVDLFGIRRSAIGLVTVILKKSLHIPLCEVIEQAIKEYSPQSTVHRPQTAEIFDFLNQRLSKILGDEGIREDIIRAVIEINDDLVDIRARALTLNSFKKREEFKTLVMLAKRVNNILKIRMLPHQNKVGAGQAPSETRNLEENLLKEKEEKNLYSGAKQKEKVFYTHIEKGDYRNALLILVSLNDFINRFFDKVLVMCEDEKLRQNRLALVKYISTFFSRIANFSEIILEKGGK